MPKTLKANQFSVRAILAFTAGVALAIVLIPVACDVDFAVLCLFVIFLIACMVGMDILTRKESRTQAMVRPALAVILGIATFGVVYQWLRYDAGFDLARLLLVFGSLLVIPIGYRIRLGRKRLPLALIGAALVTVAIGWQFRETRSSRYFVNRTLSSQAAGIVTQNGRRMIEGGDVHYRLKRHSRLSSGRKNTELPVLIDAADKAQWYRPITKLRLLCNTESVDSLQFGDEMNNSDWEYLPQLSLLRHFGLGRIKVSAEQCDQLRSLENLHSTSFFDCDLPRNIAVFSHSCKKLYGLQLVGCSVPGLTGLSGNLELRVLQLKGTKLSMSDLHEIVKLGKLTDLDLRNTSMTPEMCEEFAAQLTARAPLRSPELTCKVTFEECSLTGLKVLSQSGVIRTLEISGEALTADQLSDLSAAAPNVEVVRTTASSP